jgi:hypothetical protein
MAAERDPLPDDMAGLAGHLGNDDIFVESAPDYFNGNLHSKAKLSPKTAVLETILDETVVVAEDVKALIFDPKTRRFTAEIAHTVGKNKKKVLALGGLTTIGVILAAKGIRKRSG